MGGAPVKYYILLCVFFGALLSFLISFRRKTPFKSSVAAILSIGVSSALYVGIMYAAYVYEKVPFSFGSFFDGRVSLIIGAFFYILTVFAISVIFSVVFFGQDSVALFFKKSFSAKTAFISVFAVLSLFIIFLAVYFGSKFSESVIINEVCHHNFSSAEDADGEFPDYIELYNSSDDYVNLSSYCISDDLTDPEKCPLPDFTLKPHSMILLWADGKGDGALSENGEIHLNFRLSDGETLVLRYISGIASQYVSLKEIPSDTSYQLCDGEWIIAVPTPLEKNNRVPYSTDAPEPPVFSLDCGFYEDGTVLTLASGGTGTVHYTTDGSTPTEKSPVFSAPIVLHDESSSPDKYINIKNTVPNHDNVNFGGEAPVMKITVIRAVTVAPDGAVSRTVTSSYIVGDVADSMKDIAVISVVSDPDGLFGDNGICVTGKEYEDWYSGDRTGTPPAANFTKHGPKYEREASIEVWNAKGELICRDSCGIRVQGMTSRSYRFKRFSIYARKKYSGCDTFAGQLFDGISTHSFYLRNDDYDIVPQLLMENTAVGISHGYPAACFIDGEFYYYTYIREKYDSTYISEYYGVEDPIILTNCESDEGIDSEEKLFSDVLSFLRTEDMSLPENYEKFCEMVDIESYTDYIASNMYFNNIDLNIYKNFKIWRSKNGGGDGFNDGKWRFLAYDMDAVAWCGEVEKLACAAVDPFSHKVPYTGHGDGNMTYLTSPIFGNLLKNSEFREKFENRFRELMKKDFSPASSQNVIYSLGLTSHWLWRTFPFDRPALADRFLQNAMNSFSN